MDSKVSKSNKKNILKYFSVPKYLTLDPFSIEVSSKAVRLMKFEHDGKKYIPKFYEEIKFTETCEILEDEKDLGRCEELRSALVKLKEKYKISFVNVSLPEMKTYIFKEKVLKEAIPTIEDTLKFKIEENVPLNPRDVVFDYSIPDNGASVHNNHVDVVVTVLPKGVIRTYTALFKQVGISPVSFESESQSLARAVVSGDDKSPYLIVHFSDEKINLSVVEENVVHYTSSIPVDPQKVVADFKSQEAQIVKEQINKLLVYWFTNKHEVYDQDRIENVILTGQGVLTKGLSDFLEKHLKISVQVANVWQNCFSLDDFIPSITKEQSLNYAVPIGLALIYK